MDPVETSPPLHLGQVLAAERERQGLSRVDIAQRLHMSPWQVEALEAGDYARLPKGMFLRGFVRNYARTLGMDPGALLDSLADSMPAAPAPGIVVPSQNIRFDPLGQRFSSPYFRAWSVAGVAFVLALAATYWWIFVRPAPPAAAIAARKEAAREQPRPQGLAPAPVPAPEPVVATEAPKGEPAKQPLQEQAASSPNPSPAAPPAADGAPAASAEQASSRPAKPADVVNPIVPVQATRPVPGARTVKLRFRGPSWVEIRERGGRVLLSRLNEPGSEAEVTGRPPLTVVVGNAPDVSVTYDDREFPLEPHTKVAVARFTLE